MLKEIKDYEGYYNVSTDGQVTAIARTVLNKNGKPQRYPERVLKPDAVHYGHLRVTLSKDHSTKRVFVHRLVAQAFIANPDNKPFVNHVDNDPTNNNVSNLEWCTHSENMLHAQKQGRLTATQSKAGTVSGVKAKAASKLRREAMIGKEYGTYKVLSLAHTTGKTHYLNVECTACGTAHVRHDIYVKNFLATYCSSCIKR